MVFSSFSFFALFLSQTVAHERTRPELEKNEQNKIKSEKENENSQRKHR